MVDKKNILIDKGKDMGGDTHTPDPLAPYGSVEHHEQVTAEKVRHRETLAKEQQLVEYEKRRKTTFEHKIAEADKAIVEAERIRDSYNYNTGIMAFLTFEKGLLAGHIKGAQPGLFTNMPGLTTIVKNITNLAYIITTTLRKDKKLKPKLRKLFPEEELESWLTYSLKGFHKTVIDSIPHDQRVTPLVQAILEWIQACESLLKLLYNKSDYFSANMALCDELLFEQKESVVESYVKASEVIMQEQEAFIDKLEQDRLAALEATKAIKKRQERHRKEVNRRKKALADKKQSEQAQYDSIKAKQKE